jgi:hypothetical protein
MWGIRPGRATDTGHDAVIPGDVEGARSDRPVRWRRRTIVTVPLGLVFIVLTVGACGGDSLDLDVSLDFGGDDSERSYDARYTGTGSVTLSSDSFEVVCNESVEATLGIYESNGFGRLSLSYLRPDVARAERTQEEIDAGVERRWVCADSKALQLAEDSYTTTGVFDGRYVFDMEDELMSLYGGGFEVVVSGGGASLSGQLTSGPMIFDISIENLNLAK